MDKKKSPLDQFYTKDAIAVKCYEIVKKLYDDNVDFYIEPSAGTGSFYKLLPKNRRMGLDLEPKHHGIIREDFLKPNCFLKNLPFGLNSYNTFGVIGNPPFGKNSSLAVEFFNQSAHFGAKFIAFIVPMTFRKRSIQNRLNINYHLEDETILEKNSFIFEDKPYDVPCVFQIWEKKEHERSKIPTFTKHDDFIFTTKEDADISLQRVGVDAGKIRYENFEDRSPQSHFFIKFNNKDLSRRFDVLDFDSVKFNTAGNPSVSKSELIELYCKKYDGVFWRNKR